MQIYSQLRGTVAQKMHRAIRPYFAAGTRVVTRQAQLLMFLVACLNVLFAGCGPQAKAPTLPQGESPTNRESEVAVVPSSRNTHHPAQTLPAISFRDRAQSAGVTHIYDHGGAAGHASILESVGGGCAIFDFDRDQQLDLFFPSGGRFLPDQQIAGLPSALFRNVATWKYVAAGDAAFISPARHYSHGVTIGDSDQDGFDDLIVTGFGGVQYWHNMGDGTFEDRTDASKLTDSLWSTSAAWADFNGDNHLDLFLTHYVDWSFQNHPYCPAPDPKVREICSPKIFGPLPDIIYLSNGDGTFSDGSAKTGLRPDGKGLGALATDIDLDGKIDLYVANDTVPNFLYHNLGNGQFEEIGELSGTALGDKSTPDGSMGVDIGDFNLDGLPDLWVANFESESFALYRNDGNCSFLHVSQPLGVTAVGSNFVGFGTVFFDADRDGDEDIWVSNGHVILYPENAPVRQLPLVFENQSSKWFQNVASHAGDYCTQPHLGRGVAKGDLDQDGDLDFVATHLLEPHALLENVTANSNGWLQVRLIGITSNRSAVGARLTLKTSSGTQIRQISGGGSYLSHSDSAVFWGIPSGAKLIELTIHWPSGIKQVLPELKLNQTHQITEPVEFSGAR